MAEIRFKSSPDFFELEKSGVKPFTIRKMQDWDLDRHKQFVEAGMIEITNSENGDWFKRDITYKGVFEGFCTENGGEVKKVPF